MEAAFVAGAGQFVGGAEQLADRGPAAAFGLLDAAHARLDRERRELGLARAAAEAISGEPIDDVRPSDSMSIAELSAALGVRASTLRHWDAEGLVVPRRASVREPPRCPPDRVRDARIVHQPRLAGYRIGPLKALMPRLREVHSWAEVTAALAARDASVTARSSAPVEGAAALWSVVSPASVVD